MSKHSDDLKAAIAAADKGDEALMKCLAQRHRSLDWYLDAVLEDIVEDRKGDKIRKEFGRLPGEKKR